MPIAPVATPAISSTFLYLLLIISEKLSAIKSLENGSESIILLSQYIGDFHPEAQTKGLSGLSFIASSLSKISAVSPQKLNTLYLF